MNKAKELADGKKSDGKTNKNFKDWGELRQSVIILWLKITIEQWWAEGKELLSSSPA